MQKILKFLNFLLKPFDYEFEKRRIITISKRDFDLLRTVQEVEVGDVLNLNKDGVIQVIFKIKA